MSLIFAPLLSPISKISFGPQIWQGSGWVEGGKANASAGIAAHIQKALTAKANKAKNRPCPLKYFLPINPFIWNSLYYMPEKSGTYWNRLLEYY
jgi:hypothetical protein